MESGLIALAAAIVMSITSIGPAISQGKAASTALEGMARQPEATGNLRTTMILALGFMESLTIYGLLIAIMLLGKM